VDRFTLAFASLLVLAAAASAPAAPITVDLTDTSKTAVSLGLTTESITGVGIQGVPGATVDLTFTPADFAPNGALHGGLTIDAADGGLSFPSAFTGSYSAGTLDLSNRSRIDFTASLAGTLSNRVAADLGVPAGSRYAGTIDLEFDGTRGVAFEGGSLSLAPVNAVPEPASVVMGAPGLAGVGCVARRRRKRAAA
jgi:hypothetical protein